jgi:hypothetical protein
VLTLPQPNSHTCTFFPFFALLTRWVVGVYATGMLFEMLVRTEAAVDKGSSLDPPPLAAPAPRPTAVLFIADALLLLLEREDDDDVALTATELAMENQDLKR